MTHMPLKTVGPRENSIEVRYAKQQKPRAMFDTSEYPQKWSEYIGQEVAVQMLRISAASARIRKEPMEHVLIAHPSPGIGKTALAALITAELGTEAKLVSGKITAGKARLIMAEMKDRQVLVIDEAHRLAEGGKKDAEWLLHLLQDGALVGPLGMEEQPRITVIAVTTHPQKLPAPVLDRFMLVPPMQEYTQAEAAKIARTVMAPKYLVNMPPLGKRESMMIAGAAGNNPRSIKRLLLSLRDLTITKALPLVEGHYDVKALLAWHGITEDGLSRVAQEYLLALHHDFDGTAGVKALEERLQQPQGLVDVERVLIERGLVARTRSGRTITQAGMTRSQALTG